MHLNSLFLLGSSNGDFHLNRCSVTWCLRDGLRFVIIQILVLIPLTSVFHVENGESMNRNSRAECWITSRLWCNVRVSQVDGWFSLAVSLSCTLCLPAPECTLCQTAACHCLKIECILFCSGKKYKILLSMHRLWYIYDRIHVILLSHFGWVSQILRDRLSSKVNV